MVHFRMLFCNNIQNLRQIPPSWAKLWQFFQNPRWRPPLSCFRKNDNFDTISTTGCHSAAAYQIWWEFAHPCHRNCIEMTSKMAAAAILNFGQMTFLITCSKIQDFIFYQHTKFEREVMVIFQKSKMTAVRHFGIVMTSFKTMNAEYLVISWVCEDIIISEMPWDCLFEGFGGIWPPKYGRPSCGPPKAHFCVILHSLSHCASKSAYGSLQ